MLFYARKTCLKLKYYFLRRLIFILNFLYNLLLFTKLQLKYFRKKKTLLMFFDSGFDNLVKCKLYDKYL